MDELQDELEDKPFITREKEELDVSVKKQEQVKFLERVMKHCKAYIAPKTIDEYIQFEKTKNGEYKQKVSAIREGKNSDEDRLEEV